MKMRYASLDFETTGLCPRVGDSVIEAASIVVEDGKPVDIFHRYYLSWEKIPSDVVRIHGLTQQKLRKYRKELNADYPEYFRNDQKQLIQWWKDHGVAFISGHNLHFDLQFFTTKQIKEFRALCTMLCLTEYCQLLRRGEGHQDEDKWPKLKEAVAQLKGRGDLVNPWEGENPLLWKSHSALQDTRQAVCLTESCIKLGLDVLMPVEELISYQGYQKFMCYKSTNLFLNSNFQK
jgi:hypothetical protein